MRIYLLRDYPEELGLTIQRLLVEDYTITGYQNSSGELEWIIHYAGARDTSLFEIAMSEYIVDSVSMRTVLDRLNDPTHTDQWWRRL